MKFLDLFAGIGGFRRGMELAGHECAGFCEWDKFAAASYTSMHLITGKQRDYLSGMPLKKRQKEILREGYRNGEWYADDIRTVEAGELPYADCWCAGFPCQDTSVAGRQLGFDGNRSSLYFEIIRLLKGKSEKDRPRWVFLENVKNLLSVNRGWDFARVLFALDEIGYDAEWGLLNSKNFGVPQNRERVFIIGHNRNRSGGEVFPVEGTDGENNIRQVGNFMPTEKRKNPNQGRIYDAGGVGSCLNKMDGGGREPYIFIDMTKGTGFHETKEARCLKANYNAGVSNRDGDNSGVAVRITGDFLLPGKNYNQRKVVHAGSSISRALISSGHSGNEPKIAVPVLTPDRAEKRQNGRRFKNNGEPMFTLTAQDRHGVAVRVQEEKSGNGIYTELADGTLAYAVWDDKYGSYIAVRRLTPKECFRLQGWDDLYFERAAFVNSDSQLYRQVGNGVTVNVIRAVAEKLQ